MNQHLVKSVREYAGGRVKVYGDPTDPRLGETVLTLDHGQVFVYSLDGVSAGLTVSDSSGKLWRAVVLHGSKQSWRLYEPPSGFTVVCFKVISDTSDTPLPSSWKLIANGHGDLAAAMAKIWFGIGQVPRQVLGDSWVEHDACDWVEQRLRALA